MTQYSNDISNLIIYKGKPFRNNIKLIKYCLKVSEVIEYPKLGYLIRQLRRADKKNLIFHNGKDIYSYFSINNILLSKKFTYSNNIELEVSKKDDKEILSRFLGEIIAKNLREHHGNWRVIPSGTVYEAIIPDKIGQIESILKCEAFDYEPIVFEDGSLAVSIIPKTKLFMNYHLREKENELNDLFQKGDYLVDYCPHPKCAEKIDPYAICSLSTPNSIGHKKNVEKRDIKPTKCIIDDLGISIYEYCKKKRICPKEILIDCIQDKKPIIDIEKKVKGEFKKYSFPIERLRFSYSFKFLEKNTSKKELSNILRQKPEDRYARIENYKSLLDNIEIDDIILNIENNSHQFYKNHPIQKLDKSKFKLYQKTSYFPRTKLIDFGPYDKNKRKFKKILIKPLFLKDIEKKEMDNIMITFSQKKIDDFGPDNVFHIDFLMEEYSLCQSKSDFDSILKTLKPLGSSERRSFILFYYSDNELRDYIRKTLIKAQIPFQGMNYSNFIEKSQDQNYLFNNYLGIYCKIGGIPWIIDSSGDILIMGFHHIFYNENAVYFILLWNSTGRFLNGITRCIGRKELETQLIQDFNNLYNQFYKKYDKLLILGLGNQRGLLNQILDKRNNENNIELGYYEILKNSNINFFKLTSSEIMTVNQGSYLKLLDVIYLQTNQFVNITPSTIKIKPIKKSNDFKEDLQIIYNLAKYNPYHIGFISSKLPLPLHLSSKAINDLKKFEINLDNIKVPWFY